MLAIYGRVDILVNNAGVASRAKVVDTELNTYKKIMDVNYFGQIAVTKGESLGTSHRGESLRVSH